MEIRARINLEVAKFKANAKAAGASFKIIASAAKINTDKIDSYIKSSNDKRLAQLRRTEAQEIESARRRAKIISKLEQEKYRNTGGIRAGTNVGRNLGLEQKQIAAMTRMSAKQREQYERDLAKQFKALEKEKLAAAKARLKRQTELERVWAKNDKATIRDITNGYKQAEKEKEAAARARIKREQDLIKTFSGYEKNEKRRYTEWLKQNTKAQLADITARNRAAIRQMKQDALAANIRYFNSKDFERQLASTRYALYDISRRAAMFGVAVGGAFAAAVKSAIDFESAFTSVERTTQLTLNSNIPEVASQAQTLRNTLIQLTTEIPVAFADITNIATLGAQLGIAADEVDDFTETVAKFSAITKISAEDVALSFGRLSQLLDVPASQFENLSSAIAFAGVNAVATDQEILRMSESIAAAATQAGFAAADTIGFATALASLKVRPEEARGVITRLFREFDLSVTSGGARLDDLATVIGVTSEQAAALWDQNPSQFVQAFLDSAQAGGKLNETLSALGIVNTRELNVITRLANNMDVLRSALSDSNEQYELATFSSDAYGLVVDDVASKIIMLQNSVAALGASFGDILLPALGPVIDFLQGIVKALTELPVPVKVIIGLLTALVSGFALIGAAIAGGVAGLLALKLAFNNLTGSGIQAGLGLGTLRALIISLIPAAQGATTVMGAMAMQARAAAAGFAAASTAAKVFQASLGIIGIASAVAATVLSMGAAMQSSAEDAKQLAAANLDAAGGIDAFVAASEQGIASGAKVYREVTASVQKLTDEQIAERKEALETAVAKAELSKATEDGAAAYDAARQKLEEFNNQVAIGNGLIEESTIAFTENTKEVIANALAKINTGEGEDPLNIFARIAQFDASSLPPGVKAALDRSGIDFVKVLNGSIEAAMSGEMTAVEYLQEQFANEDLQFAMINNAELTRFINDMETAAESTDGLIKSVEETNAAAAIMGQVIGNAGEDSESTTEDVIDLNDVLRETVKLLTFGQGAENKVAEALDTLAQGAIETGGELDGFGAAARTNLSNFESFMNAAVEASIAAGEGTKGAFERMVNGLLGLEQAGVDTSDMFLRLRQFAVSNLALINPALVAVKDELAASPNLQGMKDIINAFYASRIAAEGWSIQLNTEWQRVMALFSSASYVPEIKKGTTQAKSALDKLAEALQKAFKFRNLAADVQAGLDDLAKSLQDNGKKFDIYSEEGRANIDSLGGVIEALAEKSGGNVKAFANDLASLRAALVRAGAPASALKIIDGVTKQIGVSGKASKKVTDQFAASLRAVGKTERDLLRVDKAIKEIASGIREGLSARFAQGNAIDALSLAWLDVSDAAENAQKSIDDAGKSIRDARLEIDEANASISELAGDKGKLEYQLGIALKYGDIIRAEEIRGEIASIDADIAQKKADIVDANQEISDANAQIARAQGELGNAPSLRQEIERRQTLQGIAEAYADVAAGMIANAKPGEDLKAIVAAQVTEFEKNAKQLGFTDDEIRNVSKALNDELIVAIKNVPKEIKTTAKVNTDPALQNVKSFVAKANAALNDIRSKTVTVTTVYQSTGGSALGVVRRAGGGLVTGPGTATSDSIAARLSNGEYVVKAAAVKHYGVDFFNALNQMQTPPASMRSVQINGGGSSTVYLSPEDRQLLRQAIDRPVALYTDNTVIAQSANAGNQILAQRGIR